MGFNSGFKELNKSYGKKLNPFLWPEVVRIPN